MTKNGFRWIGPAILSAFFNLFVASPIVRARSHPAQSPLPAVVAERSGVATRAEALCKEGQFERAIALLAPAAQAEADKKKRDQLRSALADAHFSWAERLRKEYKNQAAIEQYQAAYEIDKEIRSKQAALDLDGLGSTYGDLGENQKALDFLNQALSIERTVGDRAGEAATLDNIGAVYSALGENQRALETFEHALPIMRAVGDRAGEGTTLNNLGVVSGDLGQKQKSVEFLNQALSIRRTVGDRAGEEETLNNLGKQHSDLGERQKALEYYEQALPIERAVNDRLGEAVTLGNIGSVYNEIWEKQKALEYYQLSLPIMRAVGDRAGEATTLNNIGKVYSDLGQNQKALGYYEQVLPITRALGARTGEARTLHSIGKVYSDLGENQKALEYYEQALPIWRAAGDRAGEARTLDNIGKADSDLGENQRALESYGRALTIERSVSDRAGEGKTLDNIGRAHSALGEKQKALEYYQQALPISRTVGDRAGEARVASDLMSEWKRSDNPRLAIFYGKQAVNLYQELRGDIHDLEKETQETYLKTVEDKYRTLADILIAQGRLSEAQEVLGLLKSQEYFDFVRRDATASSILDKRTTLTPTEAEWQKRYDEIADHVAALGRQRGELKTKRARTTMEEAELTRLDADLDVAGKSFQTFLDRLQKELGASDSGKERVFRVREAQGLMQDLRELSEGTVALYTLVGEKNLRIILITSDVEKAAEYSISSAELARKVFALREALQDNRRDPRPLAQELYRIVVGPVEKDLEQAGARTLLWSLDGVLRYVPVAALYDGEHYMVERYRDVVFTPASNARLKDQPSSQWHGVGLGVSKEHGDFPPLPEVPAELDGIFGDSKGRPGVLPGSVLLDAAFTAASMRAAIRKGEPVVHVASHFKFSPGNETNSFLLLGDGNHLTLEQLRSSNDLFGGVDLLTLSACDTAMGDQASDQTIGTEVEGFAVLAQREGAKAVIASLWSVDDASTSLLMRELYRNRETTTGMTKAEALRQAQLSLLHGSIRLTAQEEAARGTPLKKRSSPSSFITDPKAPFAHPYYWAPFILIGNFK